ncbi:MAG: extracellular solute-binding protein, partial [Planctomycetota bacterium]
MTKDPPRTLLRAASECLAREALRRRDFLRAGVAAAGIAAVDAPAFGAPLRRPGPLRVLVPKGCEANLAPVVERFRARTGAAVELESTPVDDVATVLMLRSLGADSAPIDVALPATFTIPDLVEAGALQPLPGSAADDDSNALYTLGDRYRDATWGYQTDGDVYLMFYRRDWLEDDAIRRRFEDRFEEPLQVPRTWEELDRTLEFFHAPDEGRFGGALFRTPSYIAWEFWTRLHGKGLFPVTDDMTPLLDADEAVAAGEELVAASRWLQPGARVDGLFENWSAYRSLDVFCNIGWGGSQKAFNGEGSPLRGRLAHGPTPGGVLAGTARPISYFNWGWNYTVPRSAAQPELAAEFARFATLGEAATEAVRAPGGFFDPFRSEHYADEEVRS